MEALIAETLTTYGPVSGLLILIVLFIFKNPKVFMEHISKIKFKKDVKRNSSSYGTLRSSLSYWITFKVKNINLADPARKEMFSDLLICYFKAVEHIIYVVGKGKNHDLKTLTGMELYNIIVIAANEVTIKFQQDALDCGIPSIVIDKFIEWNARNTEFGLKASETMCNSYENNFETMQTIFSIYTVLFEITIAEAEKVLNTMNGEVSGIEYKGLICA